MKSSWEMHWGDDIPFYEIYAELIEDAEMGREVAPRGLTTYEIPYPLMIETDMDITVARKGMNSKLGCVEALTMISGEFDIELIMQAAPKSNRKLWERQSDYGPRIREQMPRIIDILLDDSSSRRAVAYFNHPHHFQSDDLACSTALQFMVRYGALESTMNVRSWDLVYGFPMDIMTHGLLSQAVARCLGTEQGTLFATGNSAHVYRKTMHLAEAKRDLKFSLGPGWPLSGSSWSSFQDRAAAALEEFKETNRISPNIITLKRI